VCVCVYMCVYVCMCVCVCVCVCVCMLCMGGHLALFEMQEHRMLELKTIFWNTVQFFSKVMKIFR
jgi:hypothetical protein